MPTLNIHIITGPNGQCKCGENGLTCMQQLEGSPIKELDDARQLILEFKHRFSTDPNCKCAVCSYGKWVNQFLATYPPVTDGAAVSTPPANPVNQPESKG